MSCHAVPAYGKIALPWVGIMPRAVGMGYRSCAGLFVVPAASRLGSPSARGWLAFGCCLAGVTGDWACEPGRGLQAPSCTGWLVAVCVGAPRTRWQKVTIPLGIGCGIALSC